MDNSNGLPIFFLVHNKFPTHYVLFFSTKKKAYQEKTHRTEVIFEDKN